MSSQSTTDANIVELHALREKLASPEYDQGHLFEGWPAAVDEYKSFQVNFLAELNNLQKSYPGGIEQYIRTGRRLLAVDSDDVPYLKLEQPQVLIEAPSLFAASEELRGLEHSGTHLLQQTVFVLVAGGLGERLGFGGIKVGLPVETATRTTYLEHYLSFAKKSGGNDVPFIIMTSDDTHAATVKQLQGLEYLGMSGVRLLKQETVPCFRDRAAHLAVRKVDNEQASLVRKPHGHGDVHSLLAAARDAGTGKLLIDELKERAYQHIIFFQDTNGTAVYTMPISLAISAEHNLAMNFTCIPRRPGEAVGLLCHAQLRDGAWKTTNVENNIFEAREGGDEAAPGSVYSPYPGSINTLVLSYGTYYELLTKTRGVVPEFINPKYADAEKTVFKKVARVESLMQDVALLFNEGEEGHRVGGTVFDRFTYQPVKNALDEAAAKVPLGVPPYCASTGEAGCYEFARRRLLAIGVPLQYNYEASEIEVRPGIDIHLFPIVTLPTQCKTLEELRTVFPTPERVSISPASTLVVSGNVVIRSLRLEGALRIEGPKDDAAPLVIEDEIVRNDGWALRVSVPEDYEVDRIRGFVLRKVVTEVINAKGEHDTLFETSSSKI